MSFEIGEVVGGYELLEYLDNSRSGVGYKARNLLADRIEVLRILPSGYKDDKEQAARFQREIQVHSRLSHPNIVAFYSALEIEGQLVMTTEWVEGISLEDRIDLGPVPLTDALHYAKQALQALSCAHGLGVVHREVSPANMTVTGEGVVKLGGFGLAKAATDPQLTQVGTVMGWLDYMSPEQVQGSGQVTIASDLYSMGAVLYELVTGGVPFQRKSQFELMIAHVQTPPVPPSEVSPGIAPELNNIILKALSKAPSERFESADEFHRALSDFQLRLDDLDIPPAVVEPAPEPIEPSLPLNEEVIEPLDVPPDPLPVPTETVPAKSGGWSLTSLIVLGLATFVIVVVVVVFVFRVFD